MTRTDREERVEPDEDRLRPGVDRPTMPAEWGSPLALPPAS